jgi:xylulokinase
VSILGIDLGTTGVKAIVVDRHGVIRGESYHDYPLVVPQPGWAELDPKLVLRAAKLTASRAVSSSGLSPRAIGIAGPGEAFVRIGSDDQPVGNAVVSFDRRAALIFKDVISKHGGAIGDVSGLVPLSHYAVFKLLWWQMEEPEADLRTRRYATLAAYVGEAFGASPGIDPSLAARTLLLDRGARAWSPALLTLLDMDPGRLPPVLQPGESSGSVTTNVARALHCAKDAEVFVVGLDQSCAVHGVGVGPNQALLSLGTTAVVARLVSSRQRAAQSVPAVPHVDGERILLLAGSPGGGSALRWFRETFGLTRTGYESIISTASREGTNVVFLPHLGGSRVAFEDPDASGAFVALTFGADRTAMARAVLDGVAYEVAMLIHRLTDAGHEPRELVAVGGVSKSRDWIQIMSDATGLAIESTASDNAAAFGAAKVAGDQHGSQRWPALASAFRVEPRESWRQYHVDRLDLTKRTHSALRDIRSWSGE